MTLEIEHFSQILHIFHDTRIPFRYVSEDVEQFEFSLTSPMEVEHIMKHHVKSGKASGVDGLPVRAIRESAPIFSYVLAMLFNIIVSLSQFPADMKRGAWTPVFKGGLRTDVATLVPTCNCSIALYQGY